MTNRYIRVSKVAYFIVEEGMSDADAYQAAEDMDDEGMLDFDILFELIEEDQP